MKLRQTYQYALSLIIKINITRIRKNMRFSPLLLLAIPMLAYAINFDERVEAGYQSSETKLGRDYENSLGIFIGKAMRHCIPANTAPAEHADSFTLVTWIDKMGALSQPEVRPEHSLSRCFLDALSSSTLPYPPVSSMVEQGYPLTINMQVSE